MDPLWVYLRKLEPRPWKTFEIRLVYGPRWRFTCSVLCDIFRSGAAGSREERRVSFKVAVDFGIYFCVVLLYCDLCPQGVICHHTNWLCAMSMPYLSESHKMNSCTEIARLHLMGAISIKTTQSTWHQTLDGRSCIPTWKLPFLCLIRLSLFATKTVTGQTIQLIYTSYFIC